MNSGCHFVFTAFSSALLALGALIVVFLVLIAIAWLANCICGSH